VVVDEEEREEKPLEGVPSEHLQLLGLTEEFEDDLYPNSPWIRAKNASEPVSSEFLYATEKSRYGDSF